MLPFWLPCLPPAFYLPPSTGATGGGRRRRGRAWRRGGDNGTTVDILILIFSPGLAFCAIPIKSHQPSAFSLIQKPHLTSLASGFSIWFEKHIHAYRRTAFFLAWQSTLGRGRDRIRTGQWPPGHSMPMPPSLPHPPLSMPPPPPPSHPQAGSAD